MLFRKLRTIFSHRDDADYDNTRRRDGYMDVLKQMQSNASAEPPSDATRATAQKALERLEGRHKGVRKR